MLGFGVGVWVSRFLGCRDRHGFDFCGGGRMGRGRDSSIYGHDCGRDLSKGGLLEDL